MHSKLVFLQTLSGLHCGVGRGVSDIDAPTARDSVTRHPIVPGTSFKGVLRDLFESKLENDTGKTASFSAAFGQTQAAGVDLAAAASFGDLRLLFLPVRSYFGTFAWVTSPGVLRWFQQDLKRAGRPGPSELPALAGQPASECATTTDSVLRMPPSPARAGILRKVLIEDFDLDLKPSEEEKTGKWATALAAMIWPDGGGADGGRDLFMKRVLIVHDEILDHLCETGLPVIARNRIGENGVVEPGALWYEEQVPHEAVFWGLLHVAEGRGARKAGAEELCAYLTAKALEFQIGGDATTGKGFVRVNFV